MASLYRGGGNGAGSFSLARLQNIAADAKLVNMSQYDGVMFDVEEVTGGADVMVGSMTAGQGHATAHIQLVSERLALIWRTLSSQFLFL